jgi:hypothetical protein
MFVVSWSNMDLCQGKVSLETLLSKISTMIENTKILLCYILPCISS